MERIPSFPPKIAPLPEDSVRPLWSVMVPVYNCTRFIPDALGSVLSQDLGEDQMQIEVVDDGSTDADVEELVMSMGKGRIKYYRQPQNVGSLRNFETCINRSKGHLVHIFHGDDRVKEGFYKKFTSLFEEYPQAGAAFCNYTPIDHFGNVRGTVKGWHKQAEGYIEDPLYVLGVMHPTQYISMVVKRLVYEQVGSFYGVFFGEDWEMWTRIAQKYPIAFTPGSLTEYRRTFGSITLPKIETGQNAIDLAATIARVEAMLPNRLKGQMKLNKEWCADMCLKRSITMIKQGRSWDEVIPLYKLAYQMKPFNIKINWRIFKNYMIYVMIKLKLKKMGEAGFLELINN